MTGKHWITTGAWLPVCDVCGAVLSPHSVEVHERWHAQQAPWIPLAHAEELVAEGEAEVVLPPVNDGLYSKARKLEPFTGEFETFTKAKRDTLGRRPEGWQETVAHLAIAANERNESMIPPVAEHFGWSTFTAADAIRDARRWLAAQGSSLVIPEAKRGRRAGVSPQKRSTATLASVPEIVRPDMPRNMPAVTDDEVDADLERIRARRHARQTLTVDGAKPAKGLARPEPRNADELVRRNVPPHSTIGGRGELALVCRDCDEPFGDTRNLIRHTLGEHRRQPSSLERKPVKVTSP